MHEVIEERFFALYESEKSSVSERSEQELFLDEYREKIFLQSPNAYELYSYSKKQLDFVWFNKYFCI